MVATLPFDNLSTSVDAPRILRQNLHPRISRKGYLLQPLPETDDKLHAMGIQMGGQLKGVEPKELREKLGADYAVWGTVREASSMVTGVYNRRTVEVEMVVTDLRSGQVVWTDRYKHVTEDQNFKAKTGLDVLGGVIQGAVKQDMNKEHAVVSDVLIGRLPWCPREAPPPPPPAPAPAPNAAPGGAVPAPN